jgi:hypothetical protein
MTQDLQLKHMACFEATAAMFVKSFLKISFEDKLQVRGIKGICTQLPDTSAHYDA